jgi:hypothetical protein
LYGFVRADTAYQFEGAKGMLSKPIREALTVESKRSSVDFLSGSPSSNTPLMRLVNLYGFVRADTAYQFEGAKGMFNRINGVLLDGDVESKRSSVDFLSGSPSSNTPLMRLNIPFAPSN